MAQIRDKGWFDGQLNDLARLIRDGFWEEAHTLADALGAEADGRDDQPMGPATIAGLPRRLHAARLHLARTEGQLVEKLGLQASQGPALDALLPLAVLAPTERRRAAEMTGTPVPRRLHQIWIGNLPLPPSIGAWRDWCAHHGYAHCLWDEAALSAIGADTDPVYLRMRAERDLPGAVDVARYLVLSAQGGIYLDADFHPAEGGGTFEDYLPASGLSALVEDTPRVTGRGPMLLTNALISAPAGHPVLAAVTRALPRAVEAMPRAPAWWVTGPLIFTLFARLSPLGIAAHDIIAGRLSRRAPASELARFSAGPGLLIDWKSW